MHMQVCAHMASVAVQAAMCAVMVALALGEDLFWLYKATQQDSGKKTPDVTLWFIWSHTALVSAGVAACFARNKRLHHASLLAGMAQGGVLLAPPCVYLHDDSAQYRCTTCC